MKINLNLLSAQRIEAIKESKKMRIILKWGVEIMGILLVVFILLLNINYILKTNLNFTVENFGKNGLDSKYAEMERYGQKIKELNSKTQDIKDIQEGQIYWSKLFLKLNGILNSDVILTNFSNKDFAIFLVGKAKTRDALVSLKNSLENEECFQDINLPLSNLVSRDNVTFQIEFIVKEECVKELSQK